MARGSVRINEREKEKENVSHTHELCGSLISNDIVPRGRRRRATKVEKHCRRGHAEVMNFNF